MNVTSAVCIVTGAGTRKRCALRHSTPQRLPRSCSLQPHREGIARHRKAANPPSARRYRSRDVATRPTVRALARRAGQVGAHRHAHQQRWNHKYSSASALTPWTPPISAHLRRHLNRPHHMIPRLPPPAMKWGDMAAVPSLNISSISGVMGLGSSPHTSASKGALNAMTRALHGRWRRPIRSSVVKTGMIETRWPSRPLSTRRVT